MELLTKYDMSFIKQRFKEPGVSGESFFGHDFQGNTWQCYVVEEDNEVTFVGPDRISNFFDRDYFEYLFA